MMIPFLFDLSRESLFPVSGMIFFCNSWFPQAAGPLLEDPLRCLRIDFRHTCQHAEFAPDFVDMISRIEKSVLFRGATIEKGAKVKGCVLMHNTFVGEGCELEWVITDKNVVIPAGTHLAGSEKYPLYIPKDTVL